jgi:hypothetical protein
MRTIDIIAVLGLAITSSQSQITTQGIKLPIPTRGLEWKDVNFISISDSHGESPCPDGSGLLIVKAGYLVISM